MTYLGTNVEQNHYDRAVMKSFKTLATINIVAAVLLLLHFDYF